LATYGKPRFLGIVKLSDEDRESIKRGRLIVVSSHRGEELAEVVGLLDEEQEAEYRSLKTISEHGDSPIHGGDPVVTNLDFMRIPSDEDIASHGDHIMKEDENLRIAQKLVEWHKLSIKLIDDEMLLDGKKLFFYFTSEQRVDFRTLVKDLARRFRTRIELRQMGVRDEARIIRGISSCGLPCCCSYWLNQFAPIGIKMVKEQNIALNPSKISGICGRLMCCMAFEHRVYREMWTGLPGPGSKIKTPHGNYIVQSIDIAKNAVRCHKPTGGDISVPKGLFQEFRQSVMDGVEWEFPEGAANAGAQAVKCSLCGRNAFKNVKLPPEDSERLSPLIAEPKNAFHDENTAGMTGVTEKSARKRSGRRRARKSGKKTSPDGHAVYLTQQKQRSQLRVEDERKREPVTRVEASLPKEAADADHGKRARRRRRRSKRPGDKKAHE
jgi:cell fate regulator YaaT (PSP1 superfamily)